MLRAAAAFERIRPPPAPRSSCDFADGRSEGVCFANVASSNRSVDALVENRAGTHGRPDRRRIERRHGSFLALSRDADRPRRRRGEPIRREADADRGGASSRRKGRCDLLERRQRRWLGLESDRKLCERIRSLTGIQASTSVLTLFELFAVRGEKRVGLIAPYTADVQSEIVKGFAREGVDVIAERHLGLRDNFGFSEVAEPILASMIGDVAAARPDAIAVFCTNLASAPIIDTLERRYDVPIHDSIATAVYGALQAIGGRGRDRKSDLI